MRNPSQLLIIADSIDHDIAHTEPLVMALVLINGIHIGEDRQVSSARTMAQIFHPSKRIKYFLVLLYTGIRVIRNH